MSDYAKAMCDVLKCTACVGERALVRDEQENIPIPFYVGESYGGVVLLAANPGLGGLSGQTDEGCAHRVALRDLRDGKASYSRAREAQGTFWPLVTLWKRHVKLGEWGLDASEVAFGNVVLCRAMKNRPSAGMWRNCMDTHLSRWLDILAPRVVVFLGVKAERKAGSMVGERGIPYETINRDRSRTSSQRAADQRRVAELVGRLR